MITKKFIIITLYAFVTIYLPNNASIVNKCCDIRSCFATNYLADRTNNVLQITRNEPSNYKFCVAVDSYNGIANFDTIYGTTSIADRLLCELLMSAAMERIKYVRQYGTITYGNGVIKDYSRYEHSVGVFLLLKKFNAPYIEQIAGLLHDVSHTVFSHVGDYIRKSKNPQKSYQDEIHEWYLRASGLETILNRYGITVKELIAIQLKHSMLECDLPDLCADRLEYNLMGGVLVGLFSANEVQLFINDLNYCNDRWYFSNPLFAKKLACASLFHTEYVWGGVNNGLINKWTADAIMHAITIGLMTPEEINFSIDSVIWKRLLTSDDIEIKAALVRIKNPENYYEIGSPDEFNYRICSKFRGIDPWICSADGRFKHLTECDPQYLGEYNRVKESVTHGWYVTLL